MPTHSAQGAEAGADGPVHGGDAVLEHIFQQYVQEQGVQAILLQKYTSLMRAHKGMKATVRRAYEAMRSIHSIGSSRSRLLKRAPGAGAGSGGAQEGCRDRDGGQVGEGMARLQAMVTEYMGMEKRRGLLRNTITQSRRRATILANRHRALTGTDIRATIRQEHPGAAGALPCLQLSYGPRPLAAEVVDAPPAPLCT